MSNSSIDSIQKIVEMIQQEIKKIDEGGNQLLSEDQLRIDTLRQTLIDLSSLTANNKRDWLHKERDSITLREGKYLAANAQLQAELRIDTDQSGIVSLDLYLGSVASRSYLASLRSSPGEEVKKGQRVFGVIGQDDEGNQATGTVELIPLSETQVTIQIRLDRGLNSLPVSIPFVLSATWQSPFFRTIGLEVDIEENVPPIPSFLLEDKTVTIESCFGEAGIEVIATGRRDTIPRSSQGWDDAQLHGLMVRFASESMNQRAWLLHLLVLSRSRSDNRLLGVMFDTGELDVNGLPRQGAAVFSEPIRNHSAGFERKIIQTVVHELGHALNLAHRFERAVSRADSTSCMNYDWRYMGGGRSEQFWREFRFNFDLDEIRFLRHGSRSALIPGGSEFHTINYWSDGSGSYSPYYPEVEMQGLELNLRPPLNGTLFGFAQPVLLTIELRNISGRTLNIPSQYLDPKSGFLEIVVQRLGLPNHRSSEDIFTFSPIIHRCWDMEEITTDIVPNGGSMTNNLNLTFGSAGFTFAEPGNYQVTAILSIFDPSRQVEQIVRSNPLRIRVAHPQSLQEERDALDIFCKDVGYYLTLGGSDILTKAENILEEISQRRQGKSKSIDDPLVANIIRTQAINFSRDFTTYEKGKFHTRIADTNKAVELLSQLEAGASKFFDPVTQQNNKQLLEQLNTNYKN